MERSSNDLELQPILENGEPAFAAHRAQDAPDAVAAEKEAKVFRQKAAYRALLKPLALIITWYFFSTCLSLWNRRLLGRGHGVFGLGPFPTPLLMSSLQFAAQIGMAKSVLALGWAKRRTPEDRSWDQYMRQVVANGVSTGLDIGLSNYSLSLITLIFYTMCKSTTPVFLLCFCFAWGIERPSVKLGMVVAVISVGLMLLVYGETDFNLFGFCLVMVASMLSGLRWTITQVLLQGSGDAHGGTSGGPVDVLLQLTPVMAVTVAVMSLIFERLWVVLPASPYFESIPALMTTAGVISIGGLIAFVMVLVEFTVISETSALTFMVAGTFKEVVTVMAAVMFLGEPFSAINALGLAVLLSGVGAFNWDKYRKMVSADKSRSLGRPEDGRITPPPAPGSKPGTPRAAAATGSLNGGTISHAHRRDTTSL